MKEQVLIIDDDEMMRLTILAVLEAFEFNVFSAQDGFSGVEARNIFAQVPLDLGADPVRDRRQTLGCANVRRVQ